MEQAVDFGLLTLLPPLVIIIIAVVTRRTFEALIIGAAIGFVMADGFGFFGSLIDAVTFQVADNAWMWLVIGLFGSFSMLLSKSNGTFSFAEWLAKYSNTERKTLMFSWLMGIAIFVDDYVNILTISRTMMPLTDKQRTPREMISYIIDSTTAPVCVLLPISTWAVFFIGVFDEQSEITAIGTGFEMYIKAIPFMFYAMFAFIMVPLVIWGIIPKILGMKKAYERVAAGGNVYSEKSNKYNENNNDEVDENGQSRIINFILPIVVLVACALYMGDLLPALIIAIVLQIILYTITKAISLEDILDGIVSGVGTMMPMIFICIGAFTVKQSMDAISLPAYVVNAVLPYMTPELFPAISFVVVAALAFVTGSCWGIPAITVPILVPVATLGGADLVMTLGAIICGATFGGHACFYSDVTVLTSQACKMDNLDHAFSQFPYALMAGIASIILYTVCGYII